MTFPSATLLAQSALSGIFIGALYGLFGLGLGLAWGLLHVINLAHFGFAILAAYLCYQLASVAGMDPLATLAIIVPVFAALGVLVQWLLARFSVSPLNSLLATFGITAIIEAGIQALWTADFRKLESAYATEKFRVGPLFVPLPELLTFALAIALAFGIYALMRGTRVGRALRALAEDAPIASAIGIDARAHALKLSALETQIALAHAAAPTATSAYILAQRMNGRGAPVALIISSGTALGALTLPLWLALVA
jgi:branched-chain amino acid transport system permease protein